MQKNYQRVETWPARTFNRAVDLPRKRETTERFATLAHHYDLGNKLLTLGLHRRWKRAVIKKIATSTKSVLDAASGTGDLALMAMERSPQAYVLASDISIEMLAKIKGKTGAHTDRLSVQEADLLCLPFSENSFEVSTVAFGLRNVENLALALAELERVTERQILILETGSPKDLVSRVLFSLQRHWAAAIGKTLGQLDHYNYLIRSSAKFPSGERFAAELAAAYPHAVVTYTQQKPFPVFIYEVILTVTD